MDTRISRHTVNDILDRFESDYVPGLQPRTQKNYAAHIVKLREKFGPRIAQEVSRLEVSEYLKVRHAPVQRSREVSVLSSAYQLAIHEWQWVTVNPCWDVRKGNKRKPRRYITDEEFSDVKAIAPVSVQLVMDMAVTTGQSQGSIVGLRWADVSESGKVVHFWHPKLRKRIPVPLTPELRRVLSECKRVQEKPDSFVIARLLYGGRYTSEGFRALWQRVMKKLPRSGRFTFHDITFKWESDRKNLSIPVQVQTLIDRAKESPAIELKQWMQLSDRLAKANIARHIAALANHGGGWLIFGFRKDGTLDPQHPGDLSQFNADEFAGIVDRYLTPAPHCSVYVTAQTGASDKCVVVQVPSHADVPICAKADGPHEEGRARGIQMGRYYIRVNGPKSDVMQTPEQWRPVIHRCVVHARHRLLESLLQGIQQQLSETAPFSEAEVAR